jgi:chromosome segregation ATPase
MIKEQDTTNATLSKEELQMLNVVEARLANLNNEVLIANSNLRAVTNDSLRIINERNFQKEQLDLADKRLKETQDKINNHNEEHLIALEVLNKLNSEIVTKTSDITAKEMNLKDKEDCISKKEEELFLAQEKLSNKELAVEEKEARLNKKIEKLNEVLTQL